MGRILPLVHIGFRDKKRPKDPGDEFWSQIRETKQTWRKAKLITFSPVIASAALKAVSLKWDAYDVENTTASARRCHPDYLEFILLSSR